MRRPLMRGCLVGIVILYLLAGVYERLHPLPERSGEAVIFGRVVKKEVKNDKLILYLKEVSICTKSGSNREPDYGEYSAGHNSQDKLQETTENGKWERLVFQGFVCYAENEDRYIIGRKAALAGDVPAITSLARHTLLFIVQSLMPSHRTMRPLPSTAKICQPIATSS